MLEEQELERAIATLEVYRALLGDVAVETAVSVLQERMFALQDRAALEEYQHVTVLVADLSGFTAMSELMDAEEVGDTVNALWERLDNVVNAWGGQVDKHTGDGLIALFGMPDAREDDGERAVQAGLDMQMELALFNQSWSNRLHPILRMRIGVHCGPVFVGKVGSSETFTAVGETIALASRIQEFAPTGAVVISEDVYTHIQSHFEVMSWEVPGLPTALYEVKREKRQTARLGEREMFAARLVGRTAELEHLQHAWEDVSLNNTAHVVGLVGAAGLGKSRLLQEFERWLDLQPTAVSFLTARVYQHNGQWPCILLQDLFTSHFNIYMQSSPAVRRAKLEQGVFTILKEDTSHSRRLAHILGQVSGFDFSRSRDIQEDLKDPQALQKEAFRATVQLLRAISVETPVVLLLEDVHWADEGSLAWIDWLMQECQWMPLLLVWTARPEIFEKRPFWQSPDSLTANTLIELRPLTPIDSRHLLMEWLQKVSQPPLKLADLSIDGGRGNPYALEEWLHYWVDSGVIVQSPTRWQVQPGRLNEVRIPVSLAALLRARLEQLASLERRVLQIASVVGRLFWESAVLQVAQTTTSPISALDVQSSLHSLTQKGILEQQRTSLFPGQLEYIFKHDSWRDVAYVTLPGVQQRAYHAQVAYWLGGMVGKQIGRYAALLAVQHEGAGEITLAAEWYSRAADEALARNELETAVRYYHQALRLVSGETEADLRVVLNEKLARLHRLQANFAAATTIFSAMATAANELKDNKTMARALQELFWVQLFQARWDAAEKTAQQAELAARSSGVLTEELSMALVMKGWLLCQLNNLDAALTLAKEALSISTAVVAARAMAFSNLLLSKVYSQQNQLSQAQGLLETAVALFRQVGESVWLGLSLGYLADVTQAQDQWETAEMYARQALEIGRNIGDVFGSMLALRRLAELATRRGESEAAELYLQQALVLSEHHQLSGYHTELLRTVQDLT